MTDDEEIDDLSNEGLLQRLDQVQRLYRSLEIVWWPKHLLRSHKAQLKKLRAAVLWRMGGKQ